MTTKNTNTLEMPKFEVIELSESDPRRKFTFTVDGIPSFMSYPNRHAVERAISRLQAGRSSEAFGGSGVAIDKKSKKESKVGYASMDGQDKQARAHIEKGDEIVTEEVESKSGKKKTREKQPAYVIHLDNKTYQGTSSLQESKALAAIHAFMTRGKLGLKQEIADAFQDKVGKKCKVHYFNRKLVLKDQDGELWWIGINMKAPLTKKYTFKPVLGKLPGKLGEEVRGIGLKMKD